MTQHAPFLHTGMLSDRGRTYKKKRPRKKKSQKRSSCNNTHMHICAVSQSPQRMCKLSCPPLSHKRSTRVSTSARPRRTPPRAAPLAGKPPPDPQLSHNLWSLASTHHHHHHQTLLSKHQHSFHRPTPPYLSSRPSGNDSAGSSRIPGRENSGSGHVEKRAPKAFADIVHTPGTGSGTCGRGGWGTVVFAYPAGRGECGCGCGHPVASDRRKRDDAWRRSKMERSSFGTVVIPPLETLFTPRARRTRRTYIR